MNLEVLIFVVIIIIGISILLGGIDLSSLAQIIPPKINTR